MCYKLKSQKLNLKFCRSTKLRKTCDTATCSLSEGGVIDRWVGLVEGSHPDCSLVRSPESVLFPLSWEAVHQWASCGRGFKKPTSPPPRWWMRFSSLAIRPRRSRQRVWAARRRLGTIWGSLCRATVSGPSPSRSPGKTAGPWGWLWWCADAGTVLNRFRWSRRAERLLNPNPGGAG